MSIVDFMKIECKVLKAEVFSGVMEVKDGEKVSLDLYLAEELQKEGVVQVKVPDAFRKVAREKAWCGASCVDLKLFGPSYYTFGYRVAKLLNDESLVHFLDNLFQKRWEELIPECLDDPKKDALLEMDELELIEAYRNGCV